MNGVLTMSKKEVDRIMIIKQTEENKLTVTEASVMLGISERQIYRILNRVRLEGSKGIIHKLRGRESNRGFPKELKGKIIQIYRKQYWDYGPSLYTEMLTKYHNISLNRETVRRWLREESITTSLRKKTTPEEERKKELLWGIGSVRWQLS
jgi:transposase